MKLIEKPKELYFKLHSVLKDFTLIAMYVDDSLLIASRNHSIIKSLKPG